MERFIWLKAKDLAVLGFVIMIVNAILIYCNLSAKHYKLIVFNSILAAGLLYMLPGANVIMLMGIHLLIGGAVTAILVFNDIRDKIS
jgi:hypothetical protein